VRAGMACLSKHQQSITKKHVWPPDVDLQQSAGHAVVPFGCSSTLAPTYFAAGWPSLPSSLTPHAPLTCSRKKGMPCCAAAAASSRRPRSTNPKWRAPAFRKPGTRLKATATSGLVLLLLVEVVVLAPALLVPAVLLLGPAPASPGSCAAGCPWPAAGVWDSGAGSPVAVTGSGPGDTGGRLLRAAARVAAYHSAWLSLRRWSRDILGWRRRCGGVSHRARVNGRAVVNVQRNRRAWWLDWQLKKTCSEVLRMYQACDLPRTHQYRTGRWPAAALSLLAPAPVDCSVKGWLLAGRGMTRQRAASSCSRAAWPGTALAAAADGFMGAYA
jgi:hypothetical protein